MEHGILDVHKHHKNDKDIEELSNNHELEKKDYRLINRAPAFQI
jgi:hypothetical protein